MIHKFISNDNQGNVNTLEIGSDYTKISKVVDPVNDDDVANKKYVDNAGSGSLPAVTSADNGKVLGVVDGAWAADSNLFIVTVSLNASYSNESDKTYAEISSAIDAGKIVVCYRINTYYSLLGVNSSAIYFYSASDSSLIAITASGSGKDATVSFQKFLPQVRATDNGSELIAKNGAWNVQQKKFIVTLTPTSPDYSGTMDKTVAEINAAYEAGQEIVFDIVAPGGHVELKCTQAGYDGAEFPSFNAYIIMDTNNALILAYTGTTNDGTKQTYSTIIYSLTPAS